MSTSSVLQCGRVTYAWVNLQSWCDAAKGKGRATEAGLAASAMYVLQVTQASPMWASEHDTAFIR